MGFNKPLDQRIPPLQLDSVIQNELAKYLINADFRSGVFDIFGRRMKSFTAQEDDETLRNSIFKIKLFPQRFCWKSALPQYLFSQPKKLFAAHHVFHAYFIRFVLIPHHWHFFLYDQYHHKTEKTVFD